MHAAAGHANVGLGVEDGEVADHALGDVVQDGGAATASITRHRLAGDRRQLDPDPGSATVVAGFVALCSYDRVPLPNAKPTDKLGIAHGGLLRLLVGFATSSISDLACPPNMPTRRPRRTSRRSQKNHFYQGT